MQNTLLQKIEKFEDRRRQVRSLVQIVHLFRDGYISQSRAREMAQQHAPDECRGILWRKLSE